MPDVKELMVEELNNINDEEIQEWLLLGSSDDIEALLDYLMANSHFLLYTKINNYV